MTALELIYLERAEQRTKHGFTPEHDAALPEGELENMAVAIIQREGDEWPGQEKYWERIRAKSRTGQLVVAVALLVAKLDLLLAEEDAALEQESAWPNGSAVRLVDDLFGPCLRAGMDPAIAEHMSTHAGAQGHVRAAWRANGALWLRIGLLNSNIIEVPRTACVKTGAGRSPEQPDNRQLTTDNRS